MPIATVLLFEGGIGVVGLAIAFVVGIPIRPGRTDATALAAAAAGFAVLAALFFVVVRVRWAPFQRINAKLSPILKTLFAGRSLGALLLISVVAGAAEEILFRGALQQIAERYLSTAGAIVAANVVFGLAHAITPAYAVLAFAMGVVLSVVFVVSDSLVAAAATHAVYDFFALALYLRSRRGCPASK